MKKPKVRKFCKPIKGLKIEQPKEITFFYFGCTGRIYPHTIKLK